MILNEFNFDQALEENKLILLYFSAEWCGPCKKFRPVLNDFFEKHLITIGKIDVDDQAEIAQKYEVSSIPTVIVVEDGKEVHRFIGALPLVKLEKELEQWI